MGYRIWFCFIAVLVTLDSLKGSPIGTNHSELDPPDVIVKGSFVYNALNLFPKNTQQELKSLEQRLSALEKPKDDVLLHIESGELCGAVFLDLTKAFDTVDHKILLYKLSAIGVSPSTLQWFKSYLSHLKQRTSCGDAMSDPLPMTLC
ncbi:uncharacterized protein LOC111331625 [Stylophora pistillata]|nr:uncharacterized protein LOC111331625 [Stylophora pistillata]